MGGGPSAEEKRAQREAEERARQQQAQQTQFIQAANVPDPLEERLRERDTKWLDWESGASGPRDVINAPLGAGLDLYTNAARRQSGERFGIGALALGAQGSDPNLSQLLKQQSEDVRQQEAAGGLEQAVRMKSAEVNRSALPLAEFAQGRRMGLASLASGNAANATNAYLQFLARPRRQSFWQQLLLQGVGGAAQGASSAAVAASDSRLKTNIRPMSDKLRELNGVLFEWGENAQALGYTPHQTAGGVLAEDVERVFPELVSIDSDGYKRVDYMALTGMLVEAFKERQPA